jgi:hypothetical protein
VDGPDRPIVRHAPLPDWESVPDAYGPFLKLVQIPRAVALGTDVVVISVALRDVLAGVDPDAFERQLAALGDLIAFSMDCPVLWVTPPPYPADPDRIRPYAAAIRRVADARRMPVADVYTAFIGMRSESRPLFRRRDLALSASGQALAAQVIARALLGDGKAVPGFRVQSRPRPAADRMGQSMRNIEHRRPDFPVQCSMLDVGCSMFGFPDQVSSLIPSFDDFRRQTFH